MWYVWPVTGLQVLSAICGEAAVDTVATLAGLMEFIDRAISDVTVPTQTRSLFKQQLTAVCMALWLAGALATDCVVLDVAVL